MEAIYTDATLVVSRSGGMTAELTAVGVPAVLVPLPGAPGDHQTANAEALAAVGAAVMVRDAALDPARLDTELTALLADPDRSARHGRRRARARAAGRHRPLRRPRRGGRRCAVNRRATWSSISPRRARCTSSASAARA